MKTIYWITTGIVTVAFFVTGLGNLVPFDHIFEDMTKLGYPAYFMTVLGLWKILGSLCIIIPGRARLKEWAYAGMIFDLTGAAFSRFSMGEPFPMIFIPLAISGLVITSWATRPESRSGYAVLSRF